MQDEALIDRLRSIKHYFFLDLGDFFVHFVDIAEEELQKMTKHVSVDKLESLLEMACRTSSANGDGFKDDLSCELATFTLYESLYAIHNISGMVTQSIGEEDTYFSNQEKYKGLETFSLDYRVKWPLTLIISRRSLIRYQIIFRHLFYCKYVER
jgi:gamma-tubulin complex component 2